MNAEALVRAISDYTARTLPDLLDRGPATSALAPWMLAALVAPAASGEDREAIEAALGLPADEAAGGVARLLTVGPTPLRSAVALWRSALLATDGDFGRWEAGIPEGAARGPIPTQDAADAWTRDRTLGLIGRFPADLSRDALCVLAAAIAAKVSWAKPLSVVQAPSNAWSVGRMLVAHLGGVVDTPAGLVGVASASSADGLTVYSFIADAAVDRGRLASAALELLAAWHLDRRRPAWIPPGRLPAQGHAWAVEDGFGNGEAIVPSFEERTDGADIGALPGIAEAVRVLGPLVSEAAPLEARPAKVDAAMSAVARYDRLGFEAAAVATFVARPASIPKREPVLYLRFNRPHLVVAVATDEAWAGLPLFAAWVDAGVRETEPA